MSARPRLSLGDALEVFLPELGDCAFGLLRLKPTLVTSTRGRGVQSIVGIELLESLRGANNGTVDGHFYFHVADGHGMLVKMENVRKKLTVSDLMARLKSVMGELKQRNAVIDRMRAKLSSRKTASASADISDDSDLERAFTEEKTSMAMSASRDVSDDSPKYDDSPIAGESDDDDIIENDTSDEDSSEYSTSFSSSESESESERVAEFLAPTLRESQCHCTPVSTGACIELEKEQATGGTQLSATARMRIDALVSAKAKKKRVKVSEPYTPIEMASTRAERSRMNAMRERRAEKNSQFQFAYPMSYDSDNTDTSLSSDYGEAEEYDSDSSEDSDSAEDLQPPSSILSPRGPPPKRPLPVAKSSSAPKKAAAATLKPMEMRRTVKKSGVKRRALKKPMPKQELPETPIDARKKKARLAERKKHAQKKHGTAIDSSTAIGSGKKKGVAKKKTKAKSGKAVTGKFGSGTRDSRELVGERSPVGDSTKDRGITSMTDERRAKRYGGKLRRDADEYKHSSAVKSKRGKVVTRKRGRTGPPPPISAKVLTKRTKKKKVKKKKSSIELKQSLEVSANPYLDQSIMTPTETEAMPAMDFERHATDHYAYDKRGRRGRERVVAGGHSASKSVPVDFGDHFGSGHPVYGGGYRMPPSFVSTHGEIKKESTTTYTETISGHHFI